MIVKMPQFNAYTGNMEDSAQMIALKESFLKSAEEVVVAALGFSPVLATRKEFASGIGQNRLYLKAHPIKSIQKIAVDGVELAGSDYTLLDTYVRYNRGTFPQGIENVEVEYEAGWDEKEMPATIVQAILNIAALKLAEAGGNIGITGKSMGDNSRTFINYTNYDKWLKPLDSLKVVRFD